MSFIKKERASTRKRKAPIRFASLEESKSETTTDDKKNSTEKSDKSPGEPETPKKTCVIRDTFDKILKVHKKDIRKDAKKQWVLAQTSKKFGKL